MIRFRCVCGKQLVAEDALVGKRINCPACGRSSAPPATLGKGAPPEVIPVGRPRRSIWLPIMVMFFVAAVIAVMGAVFIMDVMDERAAQDRANKVRGNPRSTP
jgi:hypothetical protein